MLRAYSPRRHDPAYMLGLSTKLLTHVGQILGIQTAAQPGHCCGHPSITTTREALIRSTGGEYQPREPLFTLTLDRRVPFSPYFSVIYRIHDCARELHSCRAV